MEITQVQIITLSIAVTLMGLLNGYKYALSRSRSKFMMNKRDAVLEKYIKLFDHEEKYTLSFLFISILCICFYASMITIIVRNNFEYFSNIVREISQYRLVWLGMLILASTLVVFLASWLIPRLIFSIRPQGMVKFFFPLMNGLHKLVYPIANAIYDFSKNFVKAMFNEKSVFSKDILVRSQLSANELRAVLDPNAAKNEILLSNAYEFQTRRVKNIVVPRNEIYYVHHEDSVEDAHKEFERTQLSKLVVVKDNIDSILGYIHYLDFFHHPQTIDSITKTMDVVPEGMSLPLLLEKMKKDNKSMAWVVDEFGGTSGIVTMEDIVEELFGDIQDEHDVQIEYVERKLGKDRYLFSGRLDLDDISKKYGIEFPADYDVETLSGYIIQHSNEIPKKGEKIKIGDYQFLVLSVRDKKIETVEVSKLAQ